MARTTDVKRLSKIVEIGNQSLARMGIPGAQFITEDLTVQKCLATVGQGVEASLQQKEINDFLAKQLPDAIKGIKALSPIEPPSPKISRESAPMWLDWICALPAVKAAMAEHQPGKVRADASPLLHYLHELARLQDQDAIAQAEDSKTVDLQQVRSRAPQSHGVEAYVMAFALPPANGRGNATPRILFTTRLVPRTGAGWDGFMGPPPHPELLFSIAAFFDRDGEPKGNYDIEKIATISTKEWLPQQTESWDAFLAEIDQRCIAIFGGPLHEFAQIVFGDHTPNLFAILVDEKKIQPSPWRTTFLRLLTGEITSHTVDTVLTASVPPAQMARVRLATAPRAEFRGHMDSRAANGSDRQKAFPLDATQRLAAMYAVTLTPAIGSCILPVNGPPGTGKTSFLKAVLATKWVNAALKQAPHPPLVFGTGATNKAVVNVIEAFSDVAGHDPLSMSGRWLDGLPSYGWFYPSAAAAKGNPSFMQLGYDKADRNPFSPQGAAADFKQIPLETHERAYLARANAVLSFQNHGKPDVQQVVSALHQRMVDHDIAMQAEISAYQSALDLLRKDVAAARRTAGHLLTLVQIERNLSQTLDTQVDALRIARDARDAGTQFLQEARHLLTGWRSWLPASVQAVFFKKQLSDLQVLYSRGQAAFTAASLLWTDVLPLLEKSLTEATTTEASRQARVLQLQAQCQSTRLGIQKLQGLRAKRCQSVQSASSMMHPVTQLLPGEASTLRSLLQLCGKYPIRQSTALDQLWARFDSRQDLEHRVPLFHLAARYWEGRWITDTRNPKAGFDHAQRLQRLMMLGVIVVATTHRIAKLGKYVKADLLVMDEAGQCSPEVAVSALAVCETAVFVGDTKQLQPISLMTQEKIDQIARQFGIVPSALPKSLNPCGVSGMAVAQRGTHLRDDGDDPGVTLLYHYRCHPTIIGYCNDLLYKGRMHIVRRNEPTLCALPPMSWVDVASSTPTRKGTSWTNDGEISEVIQWIEQSHQALCMAYAKPLDQILAVITPLAAQAFRAKELMTERLGPLLGKDVIERMTIGTVHRLQGAERPVVAFSLVQQISCTPSLFADRDGGFLMNVAVSRAKDAFIVFADRATLNPALSDEKRSRKAGNGPVAQLGAYMRHHGTRLYPRSLVIVEAPGKVKAIKTALGLRVAVLATSGTLMQSHLTPQGELTWDAPPETFLDGLRVHNGLLDEVVIATDDDLAGEMIGWQVATLAATNLTPALPVRRMRFHAMEAIQLRQSYQLAGANFDTAMLSAALLRECARHHDKTVFEQAMPGQSYVSAPRRDLTAVVERESRDQGQCVYVAAKDAQGTMFEGFIPENGSTLATPKLLPTVEAHALVKTLRDTTISPQALKTIEQIPPLYPPSTTLRILSLAADELGIAPWEAQEHLNALYQEGARS